MLILVRTYVYTHEDSFLYAWGHMFVRVRTYEWMILIFIPRGIFLNKSAWTPRDSVWVFLESGETFSRKIPRGWNFKIKILISPPGYRSSITRNFEWYRYTLRNREGWEVVVSGSLSFSSQQSQKQIITQLAKFCHCFLQVCVFHLGDVIRFVSC